MSELSNAVTVLIARMESHPEDFEMYGMNKAKFADTAEALYELAGVTDGRGKASAYWFLSEADKEALLEAWKKYHCTRMEKRVMEAIFDDGAEEREREMQNAAQNMLGMATNGSTTVRANSFTVGNETIDESLITKLKKWVEEK
jgi:hypothetical protein